MPLFDRRKILAGLKQHFICYSMNALGLRVSRHIKKLFIDFSFWNSSQCVNSAFSTFSFPSDFIFSIGLDSDPPQNKQTDDFSIFPPPSHDFRSYLVEQLDSHTRHRLESFHSGDGKWQMIAKKKNYYKQQNIALLVTYACQRNLACDLLLLLLISFFFVSFRNCAISEQRIEREQRHFLITFNKADAENEVRQKKNLHSNHIVCVNWNQKTKCVYINIVLI